MKNKSIKLWLLLIIFFSGITANAYDFYYDGLYYNILSKEDRTVETTYYYTQNDKYSDYISGEIEIPKKLIYWNETYTVTAIGHDSFSYCSLNSVIIPNSVSSIGDYAFSFCSGLTSVSIPNSVSSIGNYAFLSSGLTSVSIPNSVTSISSGAFGYCRGLTSVDIGSSVTYIGYCAFEYCRGLTSVSIPNSVTSIGSGAFRHCTGLTSVSIPNSVTSIGSGAFRHCTGLTSVSIPNSVTSIGSGALNGCISLTEIAVDANNDKYCSINGVLYSKDKTNLIKVPQGYKTSFVSIPNSVTSIGDYAFENCTGLTSVSIPNSVTSIGSGAFRYCGGLTSISIPNSVTSIGSEAFKFCRNLTSVTIGNSVTSIGQEAFFGSGLTSVTIGNSVTSIEPFAFTHCYNLQYIYCLPTTPPKYEHKDSAGDYLRFSDENYKNATLFVPVGTLSAYEKVDPWRNFWNIEEYDFSGVDDITIEDYSECPVEIYNLSGNKVGSSKENLSPGIYIIRQGRKVEKIMIQ